MFEDIFTLLKKIQTIVSDVEKGDFKRFDDYRILAREWDSLIARYYNALPEHIRYCYTLQEFEQAFQRIYKFSKYVKGGENNDK